MKINYEKIEKVIEYAIYAYIFIMFLSKGEGIRNILIFGSFALWCLTLRHRNNLHLLKSPLAKLCYIFVGSTFVSVIFSIDPLYSFSEFKEEPIKLAILFSMITTVMSDEKRLLRTVYMCFFASVLVVSLGYYSYILYDLPNLKPETPLMYSHYNRYAGYINTLMPIAFILFAIWKRIDFKIIFTVIFTLEVLSLILSTSRGGYIAFFGISFTWSYFISRARGYPFSKVIAGIAIIVIIAGALSYLFFPNVKEGITRSESGDLYTLNERTGLWDAAITSIKNRPVFGFGYGSSIFFRDEPFLETPYKKAPPKGTHNEFIKIMFHQGIVGLLPYVLLIVSAIVIFWKEALRSSGIKRYILIACASVFVGNYVLHALFESMFKFHHIAFVLGLGMAAKGLNENSDR